MTIRNKTFVRVISILIFLFVFCNSVCAAGQTWIIAATRFSKNKTAIDISDSLCELFPSEILEHLGTNLHRDITPDEKYERKEYELRTARLSLFLQLSSEHKKRDALVLGDYSQKELNKKIKLADQKIKEIEEKIEANLNEQKLLYEESQKNMELVNSGKYTKEKEFSEGQKWLYLFKNLFTRDESLISQEEIAFYAGDTNKLFSLSEQAVSEGPDSYLYEREINNAKINTLITGSITSYGEYVSVTVEASLFPGNKKLAAVTEVGSLREVDFISSSIAQKLIPELTNALPVKLQIQVEPKDLAGYKFYLDDKLYTSDLNEVLIDSGIHSMQFQAEGYRWVGTTYNFQGNRNYLIEVQMQPDVQNFVYLKEKVPSDLQVYADGESAEKLDSQYSKIKVNGQTILGQFINSDGVNSFFYIPQNALENQMVVKVNPKVKDRSDYIEKRRKIMYGSYSTLIVSLIPTFYTRGQFVNYSGAWNVNPSQENYDRAAKMATASNVCTYISLGAGVFFSYELVRYLLAANSVLPQKTGNTNILFDESMLNPVNSEEIINEELDSETSENPDSKEE